ncbi:hypothetical protein FFI16_001845 [Pseudomonas sp. KBS0710]|uniref:hypothetical protein n=1 Tax=Pseudomonas sp. KBS0710 TaxID=1179667 RepID=UPI00110D4077|nr:hypothetical protein [Pseudomonas sp. KBS0710]TSD75209.1 hypothetical protein FFI16_001845 [Pseudomonas sp. KBS0710]
MPNQWEPISLFYWRTTQLLPDFGWSADYGLLLTTIIGVLAGTVIGAGVIGYITKKNKIREQLTKEIRDTNAAIALALAITKCTINLKRKYTKPLDENYYSARGKNLDIVARAQAGLLQNEATQINLVKLDPIAPPTALLLDIVSSRISASGRALAVVSELNGAITNLNTVLKRRNDLIENLKKNDLLHDVTEEYFYLGLRYANGQANEEYRDSIVGISNYTNDVIFFGSTLCDDLRDHAELLVTSFNKKRLGKNPPDINEFDLSVAREEGWIPSSEDYETWTTSFRKKEPKLKQGRWRFQFFKRG